MHTDHMTDAELVTSVAGGSESAFRDLYHRHGPHVVRYAWAVSPSRDVVHELVQDTFVTLWQKSAGISVVGESVLPWLLVTCRNHAQNRRRKDARWTDVVPLEGDVEDRRHLPAEELRWVMAAIESLPDVDRQVCELCLLDGRSYAEAALLLGTTPGAVGKRLQRARATLRGES